MATTLGSGAVWAALGCVYVYKAKAVDAREDTHYAPTSAFGPTDAAAKSQQKPSALIVGSQFLPFIAVRSS